MIDRLAAHVPVDRVLALAEGRELPDRTTGSALSVDLAGFTALTDALARSLGPREGPAQLTRQLNELYDGLIEAAWSFGGAVVGFAGDGFTAWFDAARSGSAPRAAACGLACQERFAAWAAADPARSTLALRVAVASGPVRRFAAGDPSVQRLDTLAGETMARLAAADGAARKGEVVVDEASAAALGGLLQGGEARADERGRLVLVLRGLSGRVEPAPWPERPATVAEESLRPWMLPAVFERLRSGQADFLTELRPAAALFVGFEGIDYDEDASAGAQLDSFVRRAQSLLSRYESSILQLTIGDKGSYLYASVGAPLSHEDDAFRAVRAAVRLARSAAEPPVRAVRVGVSHGVMRVGAYGGRRRRTYGALGDEVNLAARLMQKARPGDPLFSERIRQATRAVVRWEPLEPVRVKGREEPVPVFRALGAAEAAASSSGGLEGREDERTALGWAIEGLAGGEGGFLAIEGEAGLGKSRLVDELLDLAAARRVRAIVGAGDEIERRQPFHAWRPVFAALLELDGGGGRSGRAPSSTIVMGSGTRTRIGGPEAAPPRPTLPAEEAARVIARVAEADAGLVPMAPLLNAVLSRGLPEGDGTRGLAPADRAAHTLDLLAALLRRWASREPVVVVLEDAQWLDSASWALAQRARRIGRLLLVVATRPLGASSPPEYRALCDSRRAMVMALAPLGPESLDRVVASALGAERVAPGLAAAVRRRSEGSPLVAVELARALRDGGLCEVVDGEARPAGGAAESLTLPDGVEGVVLGRVDRLPPLAQRVLKVASVIGRAFSWGSIDALVAAAEGPGTGVADLASALRALERSGLVEARRDGASPSWEFRSGVVQDVVYNLMASDQRRELHRAVGEWLETAVGEAAAVDLAHHWARAGEPRRAQPHLERAADQAVRAGAWGDGAALYEQLLSTDAGKAAGEVLLRRAAWLAQLGVARAGSGQPDLARRHMEEALRGLGCATGGSLASSIVVSGLRDGLHRVGLARGLADPAHVEATRVYERLAELHFEANDPSSCLREGLRGLELARRTSQGGVRARLQAAVALALSVVPARGVAEALLADAVAAARLSGEAATTAWVLELAALVAFGSGRWSEVERRVAEAVEISERLGDRRRARELSTLRAWALATRGFFGAAAPLFDTLEPEAGADARGRAWAGLGAALVALRRGQGARALDLVRGRRAASLSALAHVQLGEGPEALAQLQEALARARKRPIKCWALERFALPAEVALRLGESPHGLEAGGRDRVAGLVKEALAAARRFARVFPIGRPRELLLRGLAQQQRGRPGPARAAWGEALREARRLDLRYDEARAHLEIGRHAPGGSRERTENLARAAELFDELGALDDRERLDRARG